MARQSDACAREVLDVVPTVMRFIRTEMRSHRALGLSVPQFRSLVYIERTAGTSLNGVAAHLGLTPPSVSKLIDGLSTRGLVKRQESPGDRRRVTIEITAPGAQALARARSAALKSLSGLLESMTESELSNVWRAMSDMRRIFAARTHPCSEGRSGSNVNS
ncbi:MAG TPA: MarR family winged helix-turn-helix transcriptional regulator [Spirochaetia bacterium]|nr:MarR family winged helix-turn-helix transcriptional regulator [Spirochaetia bacterium]